MIKNTTLLKIIAIFFILLALICVIRSISVSGKRTKIQGPSALAVLSDRSIWVSVEDTIWHLDENGKRIALVDATTLGVGGAIGNLVVHPNTQLVASVRNDSTLYFLDATTGLIKSRLAPQWPDDLVRHGSSAINYAFDDSGRVAIATGGGHAVAVFDASGRFLARTKSGTYSFTNGLWWNANSLWTTDTNRFAAVELDGETLIEKSRVNLPQSLGDWKFLGMATASHGNPSVNTHTPPLATVVRFSNGMIQGHATDIYLDGSQWDFPSSGAPNPRDIKWLGNDLLMIDGASYAIKRYSKNHVALPDFGDAQIQAELKASLDRRNKLHAQYQKYLGGAIMLFLVGFAFALRAQYLEKQQALKTLDINLSRLGTPFLTPFVLFTTGIKIFWPVILVPWGILFFRFLPLGTSNHSLRQLILPAWLLIMTTAMIMVFVLVISLLRQNIRRAATDPAYEALINYRAAQFLRTDTSFWKVCRTDEVPLEALILSGEIVGMNVLVLTNQRLLVFVANLRDRTLVKEHALQDIKKIKLLDPHEMTWFQQLRSFFRHGGGVVKIEYKDGSALAGLVISTQTILRMSIHLHDGQNISQSVGEAPQRMKRASLVVTPFGNSIQQMWGSLLIPGLGQWMQRRSGTGLTFFVIWLFMLMNAGLVAWTLWQALAAVSAQTIIFTASCYIFVCALSAVDTWRMRDRESLTTSIK